MLQSVKKKLKGGRAKADPSKDGIPVDVAPSTVVVGANKGSVPTMGAGTGRGSVAATGSGRCPAF